MYSISSFRPAINNFGSTHVPSTHHLLPHELCFRSSSLQTPATHRAIDAVRSRVIDLQEVLQQFLWNSVIHLVRFLMNSVLSFESLGCLKLQRHIGPSLLYTRVIDERLNFRHLQACGILGMYLNKVFFAFPSASCGSIFSVFNLLISRGSARVVNKEEKSSLGGLPARSLGCSRFCISSQFCSVVFKAEVPHRSVGSRSRQIHCETFTESQPRRT